MRIFARVTSSGKCHGVDITETHTIGDLKNALLGHLGGTDVGDFSIEYEGSVKDDSEVVAALGVVADEEVSVTVSEKASARHELGEAGVAITADNMSKLLQNYNGEQSEHTIELLCKAGVEPTPEIFSRVCEIESFALLRIVCAHMPGPVDDTCALPAVKTDVRFMDYILRHVELVPDERGNSLLFLAIHSNAESAIIERLLQCYSPNAVELSGHTAVHMACMYGSRSVLEALLKHPEVNLTCKTHDHLTPLHLAARQSDVAIVEQLLAQKINVEAADNRGWTPLHHSSHLGFVSIVKLLLKHGASAGAKTLAGETPLHFGSQNGHHSVLDALIGAGAHVNATDNKGSTALHHAANKRRSETMKYLQNHHKADPSIRDNKDATAVDTIPKTFMRRSGDC